MQPRVAVRREAECSDPYASATSSSGNLKLARRTKMESAAWHDGFEERRVANGAGALRQFLGWCFHLICQLEGPSQSAAARAAR